MMMQSSAIILVMISTSILVSGSPIIKKNDTTTNVTTDGIVENGTEKSPKLHRVSLTSANQDSSCHDECKDYFVQDDTNKYERTLACFAGCVAFTNTGTQEKCLKSCQVNYDNQTAMLGICNFGCRLADQSADVNSSPVETVDTINNDNNSNSNNDKSNGDDDSFETKIIHWSSGSENGGNGASVESPAISANVLFPVMIKTGPGEQWPPQGFGRKESSSFSNLLMGMYQSMRDRARQILSASRNENLPFGIPQTVSIRRSLSVTMEKDENGQNKMVVVKMPPKVTINRGWNPLGLDIGLMDDNNNNNRKTPSMMHLQERLASISERVNRILGGTSVPNYIMSKQYRPSYYPGYDYSQPLTVGHKPRNNETSYSWWSCFVSMMPMFYVMMVILFFYIIICMFHWVPNYLLRRTGREQGPITTAAVGGSPSRRVDDDQTKNKLIEKLYHLAASKSRRYTQLSPFNGNNNSNSNNNGTGARSPGKLGNVSPSASTFSFPPPYAEATGGDSGHMVVPIPEPVITEKEGLKN